MDTSTLPNQQAACPLAQRSGSSLQGCDEIALLVQAAAEKQVWLQQILRFSLFRAIAECAYGTFHWNGSYLRLPSKRFEKTIDTRKMPFHFRLSFLLFNTVFASFITFVFGASLTAFFPNYAAFEWGGIMLLVAGTGWLWQGLLATWQLGPKKQEYLSHLATIMSLGVLPLIPAALFNFFLPEPMPILTIGAVGFSSLMMLRQHYIRLNALQISQVWTLSWLICLQSTAWLWLYIFTI